jgi:hypothetical protein
VSRCRRIAQVGQESAKRWLLFCYLVSPSGRIQRNLRN